MFFFNKKYTLLESDFFEGWTDRHSHILPGVDDGIHSMENSLAVLNYYEQIGVDDVWLTPHIMEDCPNEPYELKERFEELCEAYAKTEGGSKIKLHLAAENMIDSLFVKRLESGNLLTYGDKGDELLVETSYAQAPYRFKLLLQDIRKAGLTPVLAHPERYTITQDDFSILERLVEMGVLMQCNTGSFIRQYGKHAEKLAVKLAKKRMIFALGSDIHRTRKRNEIELAIKKLRKYYSEDDLEQILDKNPRKIVNG